MDVDLTTGLVHGSEGSGLYDTWKEYSLPTRLSRLVHPTIAFYTVSMAACFVHITTSHPFILPCTMDTKRIETSHIDVFPLLERFIVLFDLSLFV